MAKSELESMWDSYYAQSDDLHGYVVRNGTWNDLRVLDSTDFEHEEPKEKTTNCKNCGAPLHNGKCDYCGSEY